MLAAFELGQLDAAEVCIDLPKLARQFIHLDDKTQDLLPAE
jgi:hypothetical protein